MAQLLGAQHSCDISYTTVSAAKRILWHRLPLRACAQCATFERSVQHRHRRAAASIRRSRAHAAQRRCALLCFGRQRRVEFGIECFRLRCAAATQQVSLLHSQVDGLVRPTVGLEHRGCTPAMLAAQQSHAAVCKMLADHGADLRARDDFRRWTARQVRTHRH